MSMPVAGKPPGSFFGTLGVPFRHAAAFPAVSHFRSGNAGSPGISTRPPAGGATFTWGEIPTFPPRDSGRNPGSGPEFAGGQIGIMMIGKIPFIFPAESGISGTLGFRVLPAPLTRRRPLRPRSGCELAASAPAVVTVLVVVARAGARASG